MSTYELDDELVRKFIADQDQAGWGSAIADSMAVALGKQVPIPAPELTGAIVKTVGAEAGQDLEASHFLRWATDNHIHSPWIEVGNHEVPWRTDQIGRITEVLSPGTDIRPTF